MRNTRRQTESNLKHGDRRMNSHQCGSVFPGVDFCDVTPLLILGPYLAPYIYPLASGYGRRL